MSRRCAVGLWSGDCEWNMILHRFHPVDGDRVIQDKTTPIRIEMFHHRIKVISPKCRCDTLHYIERAIIVIELLSTPWEIHSVLHEDVEKCLICHQISAELCVSETLEWHFRKHSPIPSSKRQPREYHFGRKMFITVPAPCWIRPKVHCRCSGGLWWHFIYN